METIKSPGGLKMLSAVTVTGAGSAYEFVSAHQKAFQASGLTTAGAGAATVKVQVSNDNTNWIDLGTISLTLSTSESSDGFVADAPWQFARGNVTAISGTGASATLYVRT
jgi:hypothetical protein